MKNIYVTLLGLTCSFLLLVSCSREKYIDPMTDDGSSPSPVTQVSVSPLPGAAVLRYKLPANENLRYIKAVYEIRPGVEREVISSLYTDSLKVDGFPEVKEYTIRLYSVSYGEKLSEPVTVKVTPLTSPLIEAYNTFKFEETFGGATIHFNNSGEASLAVTLLTPDSAGRLKEIQTYYTKSLEGKFSVRGFPDQPRIFGAVIRDRWGNLSDTITQTITPIFEELIPKNNFKGVFLPTDSYLPHPVATHTVDKMWDGQIAPNGGLPVFHTAPGSGLPQWFTFDMGRLCYLSRFKLHSRGPGTQWAYQLGDPRRFEVWGTATTPDPSGSWNGWTKLMDCEAYKPSGDGPVTSEDAIYATQEGADYIFPDQIPVRYLRFRIIETWGFVDYIYITELTFWGDADITP